MKSVRAKRETTRLARSDRPNAAPAASFSSGVGRTIAELPIT
jgi:hypothetical protein